jgi:hypothetical protein
VTATATAPETPAEYLDLQLRFAEAVARSTGMPVAEAVALYTNFHRRFGLGVVRGLPATPGWRRYAEGLQGLPDHAARLAWTLEFRRQSPPETPPPADRVFGCFGCDPPDQHGVLRIRFANRDHDGASPLHPAKVPRRREELRADRLREVFPLPVLEVAAPPRTVLRLLRGVMVSAGALHETLSHGRFPDQ